MNAHSFRQAMTNVRSLPAAFVEYLVSVADKLPAESRRNIVTSCHKADADIASALKVCIKRLSTK